MGETLNSIFNPGAMLILIALAIALCRREGVSVLEATFYPLQRLMFVSEKKFVEVYTPGGISLLVLALIVAFVDIAINH